MSELVDLLGGWFWWTFVLISCIPYGMIPVGIIFESRFPGGGPHQLPLWKGQSRAFLPGDFGLALVVTTCLQYRWDLDLSTWVEAVFSVGSLLVAIAIFLVARAVLYTPDDYTPGQWNSPTKRWHDFVMFFGFSAVALYVCLPVYVFAWSAHWQVHLFGLAGLLLWVACNVYDFARPEHIDKTRQHPDVYQPIWRR